MTLSEDSTSLVTQQQDELSTNQGLDIPTDCSKWLFAASIQPLTTLSLILQDLHSIFSFFSVPTADTNKSYDPAAFIGPWSPGNLYNSIDLIWNLQDTLILDKFVINFSGVGSLFPISLARYNSAVLRIFLTIFPHCSYITWFLVNALLLAIALESIPRRLVLRLHFRRRTKHWFNFCSFFIQQRSFDSSRRQATIPNRSSDSLRVTKLCRATSRRNPGPKSGRAGSIFAIGVFVAFMTQQGTPFQQHHGQLHGGEGCGIQPWDSTEASLDAQKLSHLLEAKTHGQPPTVGSGPVRFPTTMRTMTSIQKRSFIRAHARSMRDGIAWYQGKCMTPEDFPAHMPTPKQPRPSRQAGVPPTQPAKRTLTHRLNVIQYNVGGLSSHKLEEIQQWGLQVDADLIILLETRWGFSSEWSTPAWHVMHSGSSEDKADGILILLRTKTIHSSQIGSVAVMPGRLVHVRIHYRHRACDVICCYNFMDDRSTARLQQRHQFWAALDKCVGPLPNRNSMLIAGDMNCSLAADDVHVGTAAFTWQARHHLGPQHKDMHLFQKLLRKHHLTALNGWNASNGPTFHNELMASRIDFFLVRVSESDGTSKDVKYLTHADIMPMTGATHVPLLCRIKKFHFSYHRTTGFSGFTYRQRQQCRLDWQAGAPQWQEMLQATGNALQELSCQPSCAHDQIEHFHAKLGPRFHEFYPTNRGETRNPDGPHQAIIQQKWHYHRQIKNAASLTMQSIFHVWRCCSKYSILCRDHKKSTQLMKKQRFFDLLHSVQLAADQHDSFAVHQIISKYSPKQPKRRIQLRNEDGTPASPAEALQMTRTYIADVWRGPEEVNLGTRDPPGVPITVQDIAHELSRLPHNKSVAKPFLPALVVKMHADTIAPWIHALLTIWWSLPDPYVPALWKRAWVTLIPKPHKSPNRVSNLRCIALQEPIGKCVIGALTRKLQMAVGDQLQQWPQYAFLPMRSTSDAIRRVAAHCNEVRCLVKNQRRSAFQRANNVEFFSCCGGIQIFLDIEKAFDQLPRQDLFAHLDTLHSETALTTILAKWHSRTDYCLEQTGSSILVPTGCGVRQGCRAAPILWNCFLDKYFRTLAAATSPDWVKSKVTAFADDIHQGSVFTSSQQLQLEINRIGLTLDILESMGLSLSLEKSFILLEIAGSHCRKVKASILKYDGKHAYIEIPRADGSMSRIPVKRSAAYLGTCLSYSTPEQSTFDKRVQCARITFHRLRRWLCSPQIALHYRVQLWQASVLSTLRYGLLAVNLTLPIVKQFQQIVFGMYRQLTRNHSHKTHDTHLMILHRYQLPHPIHLLLRHVQQLQSLTSQRSQHLTATDILHMANWETLQQNADLLQVALEVQSHVSPAADNLLEVPVVLEYACPTCDFVASSLPNLRRHQTRTHGHPQFRTRLGHTMSCSLGGLPQCTFCFQTFTTWRQFQNHLDRQCCQARPCDRETRHEALLREEEEQRILRMHQNLTALLLTKPYGPALLQLINNRDWNGVTALQPACEALATQCCICDFYFSRPQDLHGHLRVHHHKWIPYTFMKASQLCRGYASNSPCRYCSKSFRNAHSCPILTQIAMLYLHMPTTAGSQEAPPAAALRCEVCDFRAGSLSDMYQHLASFHKLAYHDWQPERDMMGSDAACTHCSKLFTTVAAIRQHITMGQCKEFDPHRSPFLLPIASHWQQMLTTGDLVPFLINAQHKMRMTLHCAQCGVAYMRSGDLILHLQTAHSVMWAQAQALTKYMLKVLMPLHLCVCNPSVHRVTLTHVCPFYRQMAMLACRSSIELFLPWPVDRSGLEQGLQHSLQQTAYAPLIEAVSHRQIRRIFTSPDLQAYLRERCVLCGGAFHPALLRDHVLQVHNLHLDSVFDLLPFLYEAFTNSAHTDYQCVQCKQIFNLPHLGEPSLAEKHSRQTLVLAHYQQCPVVFQVCLLLTHGQPRLCSSDGKGNPRADGDLRSDGTTPQASNSVQKKRRTGEQEGKDTTQRTGRGHNRQSPPGSAADGQASPTAGCRHEPDEKTRLLRLLHANGGGVGDPPVEQASPCMAPGDGIEDGPNEDPAVEAFEGDSHADHGSDAPEAASPALQLQTHGCPLPEGPRTPIGHSPGGLLLSALGRDSTEAGADGSDSHCHGSDEALCGPTGRDPGGPDTCDEVPLLEGQWRPTDHTLDPSDLLEVRRTADSSGSADRVQGMESVGSSSEGAHIASEQPSRTAENLTGQREECRQGEGGQALTPMDPVARHALQVALGTLVLVNTGNHCYINAALMAALWAIVSRTDFRLTDLGQQATLIFDHIMNHQRQPQNLAIQPWLQEVLNTWPDMVNQGDPVEFISHVLRGLRLGGFNLKWERRVLVHDAVRLMDQNDMYRPLTLQFQADDPVALRYGYSSLQDMIDLWISQYGMQTALVNPSPLVCLHIDRFIHPGNAPAVKSERPIHFRGSFQIPVFASDGLETFNRHYQMISAVAHLGQDEAGHCRSILKTWPLIDPIPAINFLFTDDGRVPERIWEEPAWFRCNTTCFWLCDCDFLDLIKWPADAMRPETPESEHSDSDSSHTQPEVPLMRLFKAMSKQ